MTTQEVLRTLPLVEEILESHRDRAHGDDAGFDAYKAHAYRVVNFARAMTPATPDRDDSSVPAMRGPTGASRTSSSGETGLVRSALGDEVDDERARALQGRDGTLDL
jgi:hypothetical protein